MDITTNFAYGELSPNIQGFTDLQAFKRGLLTQQNFLNSQTGGIRFREGTYYSADTALDQAGKLIPFVFNNQQAYALEFTPTRLRFHTNGGQLQVSYATTAGSWATNVATLTIGAHNLLVGDTITVAGVTPSGYNGTYVITAITGTQVSYALLTNPGTYTGAGTVQGAYQIVTPYATPPLSWTQVDDVMYLADGTHPIQQLTRQGNVQWSIAAGAFVNGPWGLIQNSTGATLSIAGSTITASSSVFKSTDVGRQLLWLDVTDNYNGSLGAWKWTTIATYVSGTQVTVNGWKMGTGNNNNCRRPINAAGPYTVTAASWANTNGGQATYTIGTHSLKVGQLVDITGINPALYNSTGLQITAITSTTFTVLLPDNPGTWTSGGTVTISNSNYWALGAWSATTGYPTLVVFHQQRLVAGATSSQPQNFFGSMIGTYTDMSPFDPDGTVNPDNGYNFEVSSGRADAIKWMDADQYLLIGTGYGEYIANSAGPSITPTDVNVQKQTNLGASTTGLRPVLLNYRAIIPQRGNQYIYDWRYNWQYGKCIGKRMNTLADHILRPNLSQLEYSQVPIETIWALRSDGVLVAATETSESEGIWAFSRQILGGSFGSGSPVVESMCVIPATSPANYDQLWMIVKRTINNQTVRFVEYMTAPFWPTTGVTGAGTLANAFFVDAGLTYSGAPTNTITGLGYLQGQTVAILADGIKQASQVVPSNGTLTLGANHSTITVGLPYSGAAQTMPIAQAEVQGRMVNAAVVFARLQDTQGGTVTGVDGNEINIPDSAAGAPGVLDPVTGTNGLLSDYTKTFVGNNWKRGVTVTYKQYSPLPMKLLNVVVDYGMGVS